MLYQLVGMLDELVVPTCLTLTNESTIAEFTPRVQIHYAMLDQHVGQTQIHYGNVYGKNMNSLWNVGPTTFHNEFAPQE